MLEKNIKQITANEPEKEAKNNFSDMLKAKNQNKKKKTIKAPPRTVHQTSSIIFKKQKTHCSLKHCHSPKTLMFHSDLFSRP